MEKKKKKTFLDFRIDVVISLLLLSASSAFLFFLCCLQSGDLLHREIGKVCFPYCGQERKPNTVFVIICFDKNLRWEYFQLFLMLFHSANENHFRLLTKETNSVMDTLSTEWSVYSSNSFFYFFIFFTIRAYLYYL